MKKIPIIFIIIIALASPSAATTPWEPICEVVLHNNQSTMCSDYSITDVQFSAPLKAHFNLKTRELVLDSPANRAVSFKVNHNNLTEIMILTPESPTWTTDNDAGQFSISKFTDAESLLWEYSQYNPVATLTISHRQIPNISISVSVKSEKAEYWYGEGQIKWIVELKNDGDINLSDVFLSYPKHDDISIGILNTNVQASKIDLYEYIPMVRGKTTHEFNVSVYLDMVTSSEMETIRFNSSGKVIINPQRENIFLHKTIGSRTPIEDNTVFKSRIYTEDNTVTVSLVNSGTYPISYIVVTDKFKQSGILHTWKLDSLPPGKSMTFSYIVKPSQTGEYTSPPSSANYMINGNFKDVYSNAVDVTVVSMRKSIPISQDEVYIEPTPISIPIFTDEVYIEPTPFPTIAPNKPLPTISGFSWVAGIALLWAARFKIKNN